MVAHQLNGNNEEALELYDAMVGTINADGASPSEKAQIMLNVVKVCMEMGRDGDGLRRLDRAIRGKILSPRGEVTQLRAEMLSKLGRMEEAVEAYRELIKQNPDNLGYYTGYLRAKGLDVGELLCPSRSVDCSSYCSFISV